jgi:shikimate kinase
MSEDASFPESLCRIVLTGFMGAGKTTVGALLAARLGWEFADTDRVIEAHAHCTIAQIFEREGETAFRDEEGAAIRELGRSERMVIGLGGGSLEMEATREFLASLPGTLIVFLEAPLEILLARCARQEDGPVRPVLAERAGLAERWRRRLPWYRAAHLTVETAGLSAEAVAESILRTLETEAPGGTVRLAPPQPRARIGARP